MTAALAVVIVLEAAIVLSALGRAADWPTLVCALVAGVSLFWLGVVVEREGRTAPRIDRERLTRAFVAVCGARGASKRGSTVRRIVAEYARLADTERPS